MTAAAPEAEVDPWPGISSELPPPPDPGRARVTASEQASAEHMAERISKMRSELLTSAGLDSIPALRPLIADVLYLDTLARINGASGTFKSFTTLDFAGCVGTGRNWHGHRTAQGNVIYLVAEGGAGVRQRVRAWEQYYRTKMANVSFLLRPVQAMDPEWLILTELCRQDEPSLIICDTQARVTVGVEENSATEMGRVVHRLEELRAASKACVLLVHHAGLEGDRGRGSTAVKGAMQTELTVIRKGKGLSSTVTVATGKQKDDEELSDITFGLHQVKLDGEAKEDGSPVTSVVLVPLDAVAQAAGRVPEPGSVEDIVARLDGAQVPTDWGRDRVQGQCATWGLRVGKAKIDAAIRARRERGGDLPRDLPYSPVVEQMLACLDSEAEAEETAGQTSPGQVGGSSEAGDPGPACLRLLSIGEEAGRDTRPKCTDCGGPVHPEWAARGYSTCVMCDTTEEDSDD